MRGFETFALNYWLIITSFSHIVLGESPDQPLATDLLVSQDVNCFLRPFDS